MRTKLAGMLVLGVGFVIWSCGSDNATSLPTASDESAGSGGSVSGTGGLSDSGGLGGSGGLTGGTGGLTGGTGGVPGGTGGVTGGTGGVTGGTGGVTGGTGGVTGGTGGVTGGTGGEITGGTGGEISGGTGGVTGGTGGVTGGTGGEITGGTGGEITGGTGSGGDAAGGTGTGGSDGGSAGAPTDSTRSPGCGTAITRPDPNVQQTMDIEGTTRYYLLDVPANADNQTPLMLVFALHGYDMNNVSVVGLYNFTSRSNGQAITVYPQGEGPPPGDTSHWGDGVLQSTWSGNEANYTFIRTLMTDLENRFCINPSRVFITGFSMGGMFTNSIACEHNSWFRGFAPVEGMGPGSCADANAQPAIIIHQGTADDLVTPDRGEESRDFWVNQNGCNQTTTSSFTGCLTYGGCPDGKPVVYCVGSWGHTIDGTATANIWSFFSGLQ